MASSPVPNLEAINIRKVYPGTVALQGVSLAFLAGEVHALIGKNGAGKSTLVKIISGAATPTSGQLLVRGEPVELRSPREAFQKGIATVYQELSLVPDLTVAHNIFLANLPTRWRGLCIDWPRVYQRAEALLRDLNLDIDPRRAVRTLSVATQQMIEIAKAMSFEPSVLLLDEPTSALARHETESLFRLIAQLRTKGVAIVYISHRLQELQQIAQRVSVLRDGELAGTLSIAQASPRAISGLMFGGIDPRRRPDDLLPRETTALEVKRLRRKGKLHDISFSLLHGEILGIAGLVGSGRSELLRAIAGVDRFDSGEIVLEGNPVSRPTVRRMKRHGIGLTPENRKEEGLVLALSTRENICLSSMNRIAKFGVLTRGLQRPVVARSVRELQIQVADTEAPVATLSGGNQQKVVVAKWLNTQPRILLFDEPTRGIDLQAKQQIFQVMWDLSREGISVLFVSSEMEELAEVCHRILILQEGRITGEVNAAEVTPQQLFERCVAAAPPLESVAHG